MRAFTLLTLALALFALPAVAEAADKKKKASHYDKGGYLIGSPGVIGFSWRGRNNRRADLGFPWSFGGGYMWTPGKLMVTLGGVFEHYVRDFDGDDQHLRFLPEVRLGGGAGRVFGYGLAGAGLVLRYQDRRNGRWHAGFDFQFGGGIQVLVWRGLFLGGELDADMNIFGQGGGLFYPVFNIKGIIGWYFGVG